MAELKKQDLSIELPDDIAQGNYSNLVNLQLIRFLYI